MDVPEKRTFTVLCERNQKKKKNNPLPKKTPKNKQTKNANQTKNPKGSIVILLETQFYQGNL